MAEGDHIDHYIIWMAGYMCITFQGERWHQDAGWLRNKSKKFKMLTWPPDSPDLNLVKCLRNVLDNQVWSMESSPYDLRDLRDMLLGLGTRYHITPYEVLKSPCLNMPELFFWHKKNLYCIRQVVVMLSLISLYQLDPKLKIYKVLSSFCHKGLKTPASLPYH